MALGGTDCVERLRIKELNGIHASLGDKRRFNKRLCLSVVVDKLYHILTNKLVGRIIKHVLNVGAGSKGEHRRDKNKKLFHKF